MIPPPRGFTNSGSCRGKCPHQPCSQTGTGMPSYPTCAAVLRDPEGFKIFFAFPAVTLLAGQPRMTKSERALQLCGSPPSRIVPPGLRLACCYPENSFTRSIPDKLVPVGRRLEFPVHDNPLGSIAGQRHATLPACPVARGLQQFSGDAAVTSLGDHVQPLHVSGSPFLKLRQVVANRELGAGQHPAFFIFRYQHSRRLWQCAGEERRDLLVMLRVVPRPHSTPQLFPAQGIVTSDRPNFDADRFFSHCAFPPNLRPRAKTHSHRPTGTDSRRGRYYQCTAVRRHRNRAGGVSRGVTKAS